MNELLANPVVVVPAVTWLVAQSLKFGFKAAKGDVSVRYLYSSGNMPSVHSAVVVALLIAVGFVEGLGSTYFGISLVLALVVIYDALNVRRAVGEQGSVLERLLQMQKDKLIYDGKRINKIKLIEVLGHTPIEVTAGVLIGLIVSFLLMHSYWPVKMSNYIWNYGDTERLVTKIVLGIVAVLSFIFYVYLKGHVLRKLKSARRLSASIMYGLFLPAIAGLLAVWSYEVDLALLKSKLWLIIAVAWIIVAALFVLPGAIGNFRNNREMELRLLKQEKKKKRKKRRKK